MSRIGKQPIQIPDSVQINIAADKINIKGEKGELSWIIPSGVKININDGKLLVERISDSKSNRAIHGLARSIINNMVTGVTEGFSKELQLIGIGYRAQLKGNKIDFIIGYSHPIEVALPEGITAEIDQKQTKLTLKGIDKQLLGQTAADIRRLRPPDAYKGKGIRYIDERIKLKPGKAGVK